MGYTFWYRDGEQTAAAPKGFRSDAFHTFGDNNGGQTGATIKSRSSYTCYGEIYNSLEIILLPHYE